MNECIDNIKIKGLSLDSRRVKPGDLFVALKGFATDGRQFIDQAIEKGAVAVLVEVDEEGSSNTAKSYSVPIIPYSNLKYAAGFLAGRFYGNPSQELSVIGITGTNGKTSCSHFIAEISNSLGKISGVIGTLGLGLMGELESSGLTTPDAITLQETLSYFKKAGAQLATMEVTSHALTQGRVSGVQFNTIAFTNLTRDHLDYHSTIEDYFQAKKRLFFEYPTQNAIINADDEKGLLLIQETAHQPYKIFALCLEPAKIKKQLPVSVEVISAENIIESDQGIQAEIQTPWGKEELYCPLLGRFNLTNALTALTACCLQGLPLDQVVHRIRTLTPVPGRMNLLGGGNAEPQIVIDFAHTPDALAKVLSELKPHCQGNLWCVFGCGGDRDVGKRPQMAAVAEKWSDRIIITQDNPRTEDGDKIIQDILKGFSSKIGANQNISIEPDRAKAIEMAVLTAKVGDIVLIAGKGHETYQIIQTEKKPFSDMVSARIALARRPR